MKEPPRLHEIVDAAPLVVCLGPGGVGKTTIAAVLALRAAAAGQRALVLTIDPARRLADALGVAGLTNDPTPVRAFEFLHPAGTLSALMLDPAATFDHLIAVLVPDVERRRKLLENRIYLQLSRSLAGTLEYMAIERLHDIVVSEAYQGIVLDTPPTTNALDFLDAPERAARFFHERVTRWFVHRPERLSWTSRLFDRAGSTVLALLSRVVGEEFVSDMTAFFTAFGDLFGAFRARGERVSALLRDRRTVFVIVASPDPYRLPEALEIDRRLVDAGCAPRAFIVNQVEEVFAPEWLDLEASTDAAASAIEAQAGRERVRAFVERLEAHRRAHHESARIHAEAVARLRAHAGNRPVFTAPRIPPGGGARESLLAIYQALFARAASSADAAGQTSGEARG
ncbi:MAG: ArsA family ATPase [Deltaproteobacteria bacterium]|nr:ArsA family ATPase [Deltaproteobacteria bacterium]